MSFGQIGILVQINIFDKLTSNIFVDKCEKNTQVITLVLTRNTSTNNCLTLCLFVVCLSICLFVYLSVCLFVCLDVCLCVYLSVWLYVGLSDSLPIFFILIPRFLRVSIRRQFNKLILIMSTDICKVPLLYRVINHKPIKLY